MNDIRVRALIGVDCRGNPVVLATDSDLLVDDCVDFGEGIEKHLPTPGLYLFEGYRRDLLYTNTSYHGDIRAVKSEEVSDLYAMRPMDDNNSN